jgi:hypothetical protein
MITIAVEPFLPAYTEAFPLLEKHYSELALNQDRVPLKPKLNIYLELEARGELLIIVAREAGQIVGYFSGFIRPHLHYETMVVCSMDIFYIAPDKRAANPRAGIKLFRAVEKEAARRGVHNLVVGSKVHKDASPLFKYLGYDPIETYYAKWIGE